MSRCISLSLSPVHATGVENANKTLYEQVEANLATGQYAVAYAKFAEHIDILLKQFDNETLQALLGQMASHADYLGPDYFFSQGMLWAQGSHLDWAVEYLQQAKQGYLSRGCQGHAIRCTLEIARIYHRQEDFRLAACYLAEEAHTMIGNCQDVEPGLQAMFLLDMAHLATDIGQLKISQDYAERALQVYAAEGDLYGQFRSQLRIGRNFIQAGRYAEAQNHLQLARQYFHIGQFGIAAEALLLNAEIHLRWYQWRLDDAIYLANLYLKIADHERLHNPRVYARILLGNLYRDKGEFARAHQWYDQTQQLVVEYAYDLYQPWLDAQRAWLFLLDGHYIAAREFSQRSLKTTDWGQKMSFQVQEAVLHLVNDKPAAAVPLLQESLNYYTTSGDPLACCTIQMYLAYAAMRTEKPGDLLTYLDGAFSWLDERNLDIVPHWWHPEIVAEVCSQAIVIDLHPEIVRQIVVNRVGDHAVPPLTKLLRADDLDVRRRAHHLLNVVTGQSITVLSHLPDSRAKEVLQDLLDQGHLLADGYPRLEYTLMTAKQRRHPNSTIIAVFALHILGYKRDVI
ncbi:MAG: hypothetical protein KDE19_18640, partial [Caldilineaceae bacterium]|nr:hypothetical protein [Caldilineaceae bacterium]